MKKEGTIRKAGKVRPFYGVRRAVFTVMCAMVLMVTGIGVMTVDAARTDESGLSAVSETGGEWSATREIVVSETDAVSISQETDGAEEGTSGEVDLYLNKYLTENEDGTLQVTLESYVTGQVTKLASEEPADILLLLDASTSMKYSIYDGTADGSGTTRLEALQEGAIAFIETIQEQNTGLAASEQSRIAIMGFNWSLMSSVDESEYTFLAVDESDNAANAAALIETIDNWGSCLGGGTPTGTALEAAHTLLSSDASESGDRRQIVILFTDGWPTYTDDSTWKIHGYHVEESAKALEAAWQLKTSGVEIYCISVSTGVEAQEGESLPAYEKEGYAGTFEADDPVHYLSDEMNTQLGSSGYSGAKYDAYVNSDDDNVRNLEARFLYLLSSDNPDARDIDDDGVTTGGYFYTAHDSEKLTEIFETLAVQVGSSNVELGIDSEIRDYVTDEFTIADTASVRLYTADYNGDGTWADPVEITDPETNGYTVTADAGQVVVSGFDYAAHYVSDVPHTDTDGDYYGCKLIVTFAITASSDTFGGNLLATNTSKSGVYADGDAEEAFDTFEVPYADVELLYEMGTVTAEEYVPDAAELSGLLGFAEGYLPDGDNNEYVTITYTMTDASSGIVLGTLTIPAGVAADACSWGWNTEYTNGTAEGCGEYEITCQVSPVSEGTYEAIMISGDAFVHIYYPEIGLTDTTRSYGSGADIAVGDVTDAAGLGDHLEYVWWSCACGRIRTTGEGPELGYRIALPEGVEQTEEGSYVIATEGDVPVVLGIYRVSDGAFTDDITSYTAFYHYCGRTDCRYDETIDGVRLTDLGIYCLIHVSTEASGTDDPETAGGKEAAEEDDSPEDSGTGTETSSAGDTEDGSSGTEASSAGVVYTAESTDNTSAGNDDTGSQETLVVEGQDTSSYGSAESAQDSTSEEDASGTGLTHGSTQTGDASTVLPWLLAAGAAAAGAAACAVRIRKISR